METAGTVEPGVDRPTDVTSSWGIDVSKAWLDVVQLPEQLHWRIPNDATGWTALIARAAVAEPRWIVLEASGGYEVGVTVALDAAGRTPVMLNPLVSRRFAQSHGRLAKTDRVDAALLARFGQERQPQPRPLPSELARDLAALLGLRDGWVAERAAAKAQLQQSRTVARGHLERHLAELSTRIGAVEADLSERVAGDPAWTARVVQLATVPGIGALTATVLAGGLPELGQATAKQVAALVGVAPVAAESGIRHGRRTIRGGRRQVRRALYQAVFTAVFNRRCRASVLRDHYAQLTARGKPRKVALVACMRRLLGLLTAMVRTGCSWDELTVHHQANRPQTT
jgi:transposase